jgi:hypothetical protein
MSLILFLKVPVTPVKANTSLLLLSLIFICYGTAAKDSQLTGVVWYKDTPGFMDSREKKKTKDTKID